MKYQIKNQPGEVSIDLYGAQQNKGQLIEELQKCATGKCSCPTDEYDKVDSFHVSVDSEAIKVFITTKEGESIDSEEIEKCLQHTRNHIEDNP